MICTRLVKRPRRLVGDAPVTQKRCQLTSVVQPAHDVDRVAILRDCFRDGVLLHRLFARQRVVFRSAHVIACFCEVLRKNRGQFVELIGKIALQGLAHGQVQPPAILPEQRRVSGFLYQRVAEDVLQFGRELDWVNQPRIFKNV